MFKRTAVLGAVLLSTGFATQAGATVIFSDNFEGVTSGGTILNWNGGSNWDVMNGTVDLVKSGEYGITCAGGSGYCVDMDGSTRRAGDLVSINVGPLGPGTYTLSYDLSGNQRTGSGWSDSVTAWVEFGVDSWYTTLAWNSGWQSYSRTFTLTSLTDPVHLRFTGTGGDNIGMLLDNVRLTSSVPEPTSLALLGLGLAGVGFAGRRRKKA